MKLKGRFRRHLKILGPGLITGASDDDPSGIATYSQAGAAFGLQHLWMALFTFPLMASMQGMCARIGIVTTHGLTNTLKKYYHPAILYLMLIFSIPAIILNIGSDIAGMGAVSNMLLPKVPASVFVYYSRSCWWVVSYYFPIRNWRGYLNGFASPFCYTSLFLFW